MSEKINSPMVAYPVHLYTVYATIDDAAAMRDRIPVCNNGGCSYSGEYIPARNLAEIREIVIQVRGDRGIGQVEGARGGFSVNSGKLDISSAPVYKR